MKTYQILLILAFGWFIGRLPSLSADAHAERSSLMAAGTGIAPQPALTPAGMGEADIAHMAADIAVRAAHETVVRLIDAGWGPMPVRSMPPWAAPPSRPAETIVRIVAQAPPAVAAPAVKGWQLKPGDLATTDGGGAAAAGRLAGTPPPARQPDAEAAADKNAYALAESGYRALRKGERAEAARLLSAAVAADPGADNAANWKADLRSIERHWALSFYTMAREGGGDPLAASPVLGGGQSGAMLAYRLDPLAKVPVSLFGRVAAASAVRGGVDRDTAEAALGVRVAPLPSLPVAIDVERRFALGTMSRNAWSARVSGGGSREIRLADRPFMVDGWAEAGIVGFHARPDLYAGAQVRAGTAVGRLGHTAVNLGAGSWAGVQRGWGVTASRLDMGPSARLRISPWAAYAQIDYRARLAGNARPGSGPVVTIGADF